MVSARIGGHAEDALRRLSFAPSSRCPAGRQTLTSEAAAFAAASACACGR